MAIPEHTASGPKPLNARQSFNNTKHLNNCIKRVRARVHAEQQPCHACGHDTQPISLERLLRELEISRDKWEQMKADETLNSAYGEICEREERIVISDVTEWMLRDSKRVRAAELLLGNMSNRYNRSLDRSGGRAKKAANAKRAIKIERV